MGRGCMDAPPPLPSTKLFVRPGPSEEHSVRGHEGSKGYIYVISSGYSPPSLLPRLPPAAL